MTRQIPFPNPKLDKTINSEQFNQVVEAILDGKYSWACVLILRFSGYNPVDYIPYRTYNRLLKENCQIGLPSELKSHKINPAHQFSETSSNGAPSGKHSRKLTDIDYLEMANEQHAQIRGGNLYQCLECLEFNVLKVESVLPKL